MSFLQGLSTMHENPKIYLGCLVGYSALSLSALIIGFILCTDVYGPGPAFVAVTFGLGLCAFAGHLWYARQTQAKHDNLNFGLCIIITVATLQNAIMWGGLSGSIFEDQIMNLSIGIVEATESKCGVSCEAVDIQDIVHIVAATPQDVGPESAMCFFCVLLFLFMLPFTISAFFSRDGSSSSSDNAADLDYQDYPTGAAESSSAAYADL